MSRLTKRYEDNSGYKVVENYAHDSQITLYDYPYADYEECVNRLGNIEDIFELIEEMYKKPVCWKCADGKEYYEDYSNTTILYNHITNDIEIYDYELIDRYKVEEYGITWWIKDKSE